MEQSTQRSARIERAVIDAVECAVVEHRIGERFAGVVVDKNTHGVTVQLREPAIITPVAIDRALGDEVELTLVAVDPVARRVELHAVVPAAVLTSCTGRSCCNPRQLSVALWR